MYELLCDYFGADAVNIFCFLVLSALIIAWRIAVFFESNPKFSLRSSFRKSVFSIGTSLGLFFGLWCAYAQQKEEQQIAQRQVIIELFTSINEVVVFMGEAAVQTVRSYLTPEEKKSRLLPVGLATNNLAWVSESQCVTSQVREAWQRVPIRRAAFRQPLPFPVIVGSNTYEEVFISSSGIIGFDAPKGSELTREMPYEEAADHVYLALLWGRIDFKPRLGSKMWYGVKEDGNFVASYDTVFIDGDTNAVAKVQVEFINNGDMILRYGDLPPCATNAHTAGFQNLDGGWTLSPDNIRSNTAIYLKAFGALDLTVQDSDTDGDGISDYYELYPTNGVSMTDPCKSDTDGDGLSDPVEIGNGADPLNPDTNLDNIPDGTDLTGYSLSDTNLVFKLINNIAPEVDPHLDSDGDGWADWLETRFGTATNDVNSTPQGSDALFSVTVTLAETSTVQGVLAVGTDRAMVTEPGSWTFWRISGQAHPVTFTAPHSVAPPFAITLNRPDAVRYDKSSPDGKGGDFGKVALPLITFEPAFGGCCHEAQTAEACETYTAIVTPQMTGTYVWDLDGTWSTTAPNEVVAGHDVTWGNLQFTPAGASAYREAWAPIKTHCSDFINAALAGAGGTYIIYANTDNDDGDSKIDNVDNYVGNENDFRAVIPYTPPQSCCICPSHSLTNWTFKLYAHSDNMRLYQNADRTMPISQWYQVSASQTVYVEGLASSTTTDVDYVDWIMEGLTDDGTGGLVETNYVVRSIYTVIDLQAAPVRLEPVTVAANEQGLILNPCGVATNGLAMYKVDVVPAGIVPDSAIHWSIASGDVNFYQSYSTGRTAIIRGGDTPDSDFKLEVTVDGLPSTYKPYIFGRVLESKTVQVRAYVICGTNGIPAVSNSTINAWISEENRIYKQAAMTFTLVSINTVTNQDWFDIDSNERFQEMCSYANYTGGLELYCVNSIFDAAGKHSDMRLPAGSAYKGMAVSANALLSTLSHETGHACGLSDLYLYDPGDGLVSEDKTYQLNWSGGEGTGYYAPDLLYRNLTHRVIMDSGVESRADIPLDFLTGVIGTNRVEISVGLNQMGLREPLH